MYTFILAVHIVLAVSLVGLVLLQQGKGADVGAVMGSGGANSLFGASGASYFLVRMTTGCAILFMLTSVALVRISASGAHSSGGPVDLLKGSALEDVGSKPAAPSTGADAPAPATDAQEPASQAPAAAVAPTASASETPSVPAPVVAPGTSGSEATKQPESSPTKGS